MHSFLHFLLSVRICITGKEKGSGAAKEKEKEEEEEKAKQWACHGIAGAKGGLYDIDGYFSFHYSFPHFFSARIRELGRRGAAKSESERIFCEKCISILVTVL